MPRAHLRMGALGPTILNIITFATSVVQFAVVLVQYALLYLCSAVLPVHLILMMTFPRSLVWGEK